MPSCLCGPPAAPIRVHPRSSAASLFFSLRALVSLWFPRRSYLRSSAASLFFPLRALVPLWFARPFQSASIRVHLWFPLPPIRIHPRLPPNPRRDRAVRSVRAARSALAKGLFWRANRPIHCRPVPIGTEACRFACRARPLCVPAVPFSVPFVPFVPPPRRARPETALPPSAAGAIIFRAFRRPQEAGPCTPSPSRSRYWRSSSSSCS